MDAFRARSIKSILSVRARAAKKQNAPASIAAGRDIRYSIVVQSSEPLIYARSEEIATSPIWNRLIAGMVTVGCLAVLVTAAWVRPSRAGYATHLALGLAACSFLQRTGLPCPGCGMTTSFAWFVRGNFAASLYVQPMGTVLAVLCGAALWVGFYIVVTGRPVYRLVSLVANRTVLFALLAFGIAAWGWKILIHLHGVDGW